MGDVELTCYSCFYASSGASHLIIPVNGDVLIFKVQIQGELSSQNNIVYTPSLKRDVSLLQSDAKMHHFKIDHIWTQKRYTSTSEKAKVFLGQNGENIVNLQKVI